MQFNNAEPVRAFGGDSHQVLPGFQRVNCDEACGSRGHHLLSPRCLEHHSCNARPGVVHFNGLSSHLPAHIRLHRLPLSNLHADLRDSWRLELLSPQCQINALHFPKCLLLLFRYGSLLCLESWHL